MIQVIALCSQSFGAPSESSLWIESDGQAVQTETDAPMEVERRAINEALRKAIEEGVGTFLSSHTVVSDSALAEDLTYTRVRGKIQKYELLRKWWDSEDKSILHVRLKALVEKVYPEERDAIKVKLALSRSLYLDGDEVIINYQVSRDSYPTAC
jgi:hypothetical protein